MGKILIIILLLGCGYVLLKRYHKSYFPSVQGELMSQTQKEAYFQNPQEFHLEKATLAGGCFWGVEDLLKQEKGVVATRVGYTGGKTLSPTYEEISTGLTGHAEAVEVIFDPKITTYTNILNFFFKFHDPTTLNQQGNDVGSQYRSAIFVHSKNQEQIAEEVKARVNKSAVWKRPVVTEITAAVSFFPAEEYHQDYLEKHPHGYSCHYVRPVNF